MKKLFTLIELIVVIVILSILAAIVIPNVADMKKESIASMIQSNTRVLQTAVDTYSLKNNGKYPTGIQPTLGSPQKINIDILYPAYIKSRPDFEKLKTQKYWVDLEGQVWGATADSPSDVIQAGTTVEISKDNNVQSINIYEVKGSKVVSKVASKRLDLLKNIPLSEDVNKIQLTKPDENTTYLFSSVDQYGLESAPVGPEYLGFPQFDSLVNVAGEFEFELASKQVMYWDSFRVLETKPEGTEILYRFSIKDEKGEYTEWSEDFKNLLPSEGLKIKVTMIANGNKYPSLYDMRVYYHFKIEEKSIVKPVLREQTLNPDGSGRVVHEVKLEENQYLDTVQITDSYVPTFPIKVSYEYSKDGESYYPVEKITDIPKGASVRIVREGEQFIGFQAPILKTIDTTPVVLNGDTIEVETAPSSPLTPEEESLAQDPQINSPEWTELSRMSFITGSGSGDVTHWISATIDDIQPTNTRILYRYAYANRGDWSGYVSDFSQLRDSRYLKVLAIMQVKTAYKSQLEKPKINSIKINHSKGISDISLVQPTGVIIPKKSNNLNNDIISTGSEIEWTYNAQDPNGRKIIDAVWGGDVRTQYPVGTYTVTLKLLNEDNYWSNTISYTFEVKPEKPIAVISPSSNYLLQGEKVNWDYLKSTDPDGDNIIDAEWSGDKRESYNVAGNYTVSLRVMDADGNWSDTVSKTYTVSNFKPFSTTYNASANIYVSTMGDDVTGDGSQNNPYKSIQKAVDNVKVDGTAIRVASGTYYETLKHVPGSYENREYALMRSTPNKDYAIIGDANNLPVIYVKGPATGWYNNFIVQMAGSTVTTGHNYELHNLVFRVNPTHSGSLTFLTELSNKYKSNVNIYNVKMENESKKVAYAWYLNGSYFSTNSQINIYVNSSIVEAINEIYRNSSVTTVHYKNSIILGSYKEDSVFR